MQVVFLEVNHLKYFQAVNPIAFLLSSKHRNRKASLAQNRMFFRLSRLYSVSKCSSVEKTKKFIV